MKRLKQLLRPVVSRYFSPAAVGYMRFMSWCVCSYLPRFVSSKVFPRTPEVLRFAMAPTPSGTARQLLISNLSAPTRMCRVMAKCGSDKAKNRYTPIYSTLFQDRSEEPLRILELGLGTNNPAMLSNMGVFGIPGASLRGWRQLFPHARIYGADIDREILFEEDGIKTFFCDQCDPPSVRELWLNRELQEGADIIIEDGLHTFEANTSFLESSIDHLRPGGIFVVEDIEFEYLGGWRNKLGSVYSQRYPACEFLLVQVSRGATNLLIIQKAVA